MKIRRRIGMVACSAIVGTVLCAPAPTWAYPDNVIDKVVAVGAKFRQDTTFTRGTGSVRARPMADTGTACAYVFGPWRNKNQTSSTASVFAIFWTDHLAQDATV